MKVQSPEEAPRDMLLFLGKKQHALNSPVPFIALEPFSRTDSSGCLISQIFQKTLIALLGNHPIPPMEMHLILESSSGNLC